MTFHRIEVADIIVIVGAVAVVELLLWLM